MSEILSPTQKLRIKIMRGGPRIPGESDRSMRISQAPRSCMRRPLTTSAAGVAYVVATGWKMYDVQTLTVDGRVVATGPTEIAAWAEENLPGLMAAAHRAILELTTGATTEESS